MKRTNIYLDDDQLERLRLVGERRGLPVAALVRQAIDSWLETQGVRVVTEDEWQRRFDALIERRRRAAAELGVDEERVRRDVALAVREARKARAARRR
jgi:Ribbon-helix-helix protein, copG family